jgi:hypothetical protein
MDYDDEATHATRSELFDALCGRGFMLPCRPVPAMLIEALDLAAERRLRRRDVGGSAEAADVERISLTSHPVRSRMASLIGACGAILNAWKGSADHPVRRLRA